MPNAGPADFAGNLRVSGSLTTPALQHYGPSGSTALVIKAGPTGTAFQDDQGSAIAQFEAALAAFSVPVTAPNLYTQTQVDSSIAAAVQPYALASSLSVYQTTADHDVDVASLQASLDVNSSSIGVLNVDLAALQLETSSGLTARFTKTVSDQRYYLKSAVDALFAARYTNAEIDALLAGLVDSAPGVLDTLNELAAALGDDANFAATMTASLATKLTETQANALYYTQSQVDNLIANAGAGLSSVGGEGISVLQDANTLRRVTASDGVVAQVGFNVNDGTQTVHLSGASLQSAIAALQAKSVYEVQSIQSLAADASSVITSVEFPPGSCRFDVPLSVSELTVRSTPLTVQRNGTDVFSVASDGGVTIARASGVSLLSTSGTSNSVQVHIALLCNQLRMSDPADTLLLQRDWNDDLLRLSNASIEATRTVQAPEYQSGGLRVYEQTGALNVGSLVHPSALQLAVSSQATPAASEILLSMEPTTGVTVNTGLAVFGNATITGDLNVTGTVTKAHTAFDGYNVAETQLSATNSTLVVVDIDTSRLSTPSGAFSLSGGVLTVNTAGLYSVGYRVSTYILSGNSRSSTRAQLSLSGTEVAGTRGFMYNRQLNQSYGSCAATCILQLSVGDQLRVGVTRTHGVDTIATVSQGCSLTLLAL